MRRLPCLHCTQRARVSRFTGIHFSFLACHDAWHGARHQQDMTKLLRDMQHLCCHYVSYAAAHSCCQCVDGDVVRVLRRRCTWSMRHLMLATTSAWA